MSLLARFALVIALSGTSAAARAQLSETQTREIFTAVGEQFAVDAEARCMASVLVAERPTMAARTAAQRTLQAYLDTVRVAEPADASAHFSRKPDLRRWIGPDGKEGDIRALVDPYARSEGPMLPPPTRFVLANDQKTAIGLWDGVSGGYAASFRREGGRWLLIQLALVRPDAPLPRRYCHVPGDIDRWHGEPIAQPGYWAAASQPPR